MILQNEPNELDAFRKAIHAGEAEKVKSLLSKSTSLRSRINDPLFDFGKRAVQAASTYPDVIDVLLDFGADINLRSDWPNGPFSILDSAPEEAARHYIARGAILTAHAAARLGWIDELRALIDINPAVVHEKGGDGQRPLHFAKTTEIVDLLLDRGAEIDARCVDHRSTAAQYAVADRPEICQHLIDRGATPDIFIAARLGDDALASRLIDADPTCLEARVNAPGYALVPCGNIYCWTLGWYLSPHEVATKFGHPETARLLLNRSSPKMRFLVACSQANEPAVRAAIQEHPNLINELSPEDHGLMAYSMFYNRVDAVKLMLSIGFDPAATALDGGPLLHMACWHGNAEIVRLLLSNHRNHIDLTLRDKTHGSTPLGWVAHGSSNSFLRASGDYLSIVRMLVAAGADVQADANKYGTSMIDQAGDNEEVKSLLREFSTMDSKTA